MATYHIITYGCQMNERDSETIAGILACRGHREAGMDEEPDIVVLNTCCVREGEERKILGKAQELKALKASHPGAVLAVVGCMSQQPGAAASLMKKMPWVDIVLGTHNIDRIGEAVDSVAETRRPFCEVLDEEPVPPEGLPSLRAPGIRAWVTVMYGCDNFCSYCIVPYVRGRERSRQPAEITAEVRRLVSEGFKEVVLLGQNVNAYGRTSGTGQDFAGLLEGVDSVPGLLRTRFMTSHPRDFTQKMVDAVRDLPTVCEHIHLPVQSGSNSVLKRMNRGYTREQYMDLASRIRLAMPGCSLTTDIIVGFPGEDEREFAETLDLVSQVEFDAAFTFVYSPRKGTKAASLPGAVPHATKKARISELIRIQNEITQRKNRRLTGQAFEVLVEGPSERDRSVMAGRTRQNKMVHFRTRSAPGSLLTVRITSTGTWTLRGEVLGGEAPPTS
jgi:tRNA-2-methylthio-N6-dimethylallyladenosine synthase